MTGPRFLSSAAVRALLAGIVFCVGCRSSDTVTSHYATRAEAAADRLFDRGWLPDFIPASSRAITTKNDLDLNRSEGSFSFDPADAPAFLAKLSAARPSGGTVDQKAWRDRGYTAHTHAGGGSSWVFFIHAAAGHCVYGMGRS